MFTTVDQFIAQAANLVVVEPLALMVRLFDCYERTRAQALPQGTSEGLGSFLTGDKHSCLILEKSIDTSSIQRMYWAIYTTFKNWPNGI
jgi:hypothetical protein